MHAYVTFKLKTPNAGHFSPMALCLNPCLLLIIIIIIIIIISPHRKCFLRGFAFVMLLLTQINPHLISNQMYGKLLIKCGLICVSNSIQMQTRVKM